MGALYHIGAHYALHFICTLHGYWICSRGPEGAYGSVVLWLESRKHRLKDSWTRVVGSWIRAAFQRSGKLVWDLGAGYLMWAPRIDTWLFLYLHCFMWLESHVLHVLVGFSPGGVYTTFPTYYLFFSIDC